MNAQHPGQQGRVTAGRLNTQDREYHPAPTLDLTCPRPSFRRREVATIPALSENEERNLLPAAAFWVAGKVLTPVLATPNPTVADLRRAAVAMHREAHRIDLAADRVDELTTEVLEGAWAA